VLFKLTFVLAKKTFIFASSQFTINLFDVVLSEVHISLLDKGLTFIPSVISYPLSHITSCHLHNVRFFVRDFFRNNTDVFDHLLFKHMSKPSFVCLFVCCLTAHNEARYAQQSNPLDKPSTEGETPHEVNVDSGTANLYHISSYILSP